MSFTWRRNTWSWIHTLKMVVIICSLHEDFNKLNIVTLTVCYRLLLQTELNGIIYFFLWLILTAENWYQNDQNNNKSSSFCLLIHWTSENSSSCLWIGIWVCLLSILIHECIKTDVQVLKKMLFLGRCTLLQFVGSVYILVNAF